MFFQVELGVHSVQGLQICISVYILKVREQRQIGNRTNKHEKKKVKKNRSEYDTKGSCDPCAWMKIAKEQR